MLNKELEYLLEEMKQTIKQICEKNYEWSRIKLQHVPGVIFLIVLDDIIAVFFIYLICVGFAKSGRSSQLHCSPI